MRRTSWLTVFAAITVLALMLPTPSAQAQGCSGSGQFRICGLEGTHTFDIESASKVVDLETRSRTSGQTPLPFSVQVTPIQGASYVLSSNSGEQIEIGMGFSQNGGSATTLSPGTEAGFFMGSSQDAPAQLEINIINAPSMSSTSYFATFEMTLRQYLIVFPFREVTVEFTIELTVEPRIIIAGLGPMDLDNNSVSIGQAIRGMEDFCVGGQGFDRYIVNLSSQNGSSSAAYLLAASSGSAESIPYSVAFTDNLSSSSGLSPNSLGNIPGSFARASDKSCLSDNARIVVNVAAGAWETAKESNYIDVLTVTVTSQ